jgi:hypothetical protein
MTDKNKKVVKPDSAESKKEEVSSLPPPVVMLEVLTGVGKS